MRAVTLLKCAAAVAATAALGSMATAPNSAWYRSLNKPGWQPPPAAFPVVWTGLYGLIAVAGARALDGLSGAERDRFRRSYLTNLAFNSAWTVIFFGARRPSLALVDIAALNVTNAAMLLQARRADRAAALMLLPYAAWTAFATALNASIAARNRRAPRALIRCTRRP